MYNKKFIEHALTELLKEDYAKQDDKSRKKNKVKFYNKIVNLNRLGFNFKCIVELLFEYPLFFQYVNEKVVFLKQPIKKLGLGEKTSFTFFELCLAI